MSRVVVYHAAGCHLCERALDVVGEAHEELGFTLELVDIGGDATLESTYRESIPVVEIDGERAFTYFVPRAALRARLELTVLTSPVEGHRQNVTACHKLTADRGRNVG